MALHRYYKGVKFYHRTKEKAWELIQKEGVLWGGNVNVPGGYRYTYLSPEPMNSSFGPVLLEVDYEPKGRASGCDNYGFDPPPDEEVWQFIVLVPIPISQVKRIEPPPDVI